MGQYEKPPEEFGDNLPYSSGELIYSLRCFMLHQGTPAIETENIKEERCKVDHFRLIIEDAMLGGSACVNHNADSTVRCRSLEINIVNLCTKLLINARWYYENNRDKFNFIDCEIQDRRNPLEQEDRSEG